MSITKDLLQNGLSSLNREIQEWYAKDDSSIMDFLVTDGYAVPTAEEYLLIAGIVKSVREEDTPKLRRYLGLWARIQNKPNRGRVRSLRCVNSLAQERKRSRK